MAGVIKRGYDIARLAWSTHQLNKLDDASERKIAKRALVNLFADARGVVMKVGQLMAASADDDSLDELLEGIPALPLVDTQPLIERALGQPFDQVFVGIDESEAAASLGQVHHAVLTNGDEVAVKLRYPDIDRAVAAEMTLAGLMPGVGPVKRWGFDLGGYKQVLKDNMDRELDYQVEADYQRRFQQQVTVDGLVVPDVYPALCRQTLLVQRWESGDWIDRIQHWPQHHRERIGHILLGTLFKSLFEVGLLHGDPHKGNSFYRYNDQGQPEVVLLDFGCVVEVSEIQRLALLKLIIATRENHDVSPLRYFAAMGFDSQKLSYIGEALPMLCRVLFQPFVENHAFNTHLWPLERVIGNLLGDQRWWFRSAGPPELLLLMRVFQGAVQQLQSLLIKVPWWSILEQQVDPTVIEAARSLELPELPQEQALQTRSPRALAKHLQVRVLKQGKPHVNVTLSAEAALELEGLIPPDVLALIDQSTDIDLAAITERIRLSGVAPQPVFRVENGDKEYDVWLE